MLSKVASVTAEFRSAAARASTSGRVGKDSDTKPRSASVGPSRTGTETMTTASSVTLPEGL